MRVPNVLILVGTLLWCAPTLAQRQMERLGRGVVTIHEPSGNVFVSWRLLDSDPDETTFDLYRQAGDGQPQKLNAEPIVATHFADSGADLSVANTWFVRQVVGGRELEPGAGFTLPAGHAAAPYLSIPIETPAGYQPNDASVGDLDGDGEYEIVLHQVGISRDNSRPGVTTEPILQAYRLDGTQLWQINLGRNIREGAHYAQFMVYDLDGDGRAEVACKTADGTVDGVGTVLGDAAADYRNDDGYILRGPEYLTVFDGLTGAALATTDYIPPRGRVEDWGDAEGNRVDRFLACVAYLDGRRPSLVMCRGYYTRCVLAAWNWRDGKLTPAWTFDSDDGTPGNEAYRGQGDHGIAVGDVDGDGRDEIIYGSCVIDDDGTGLYSTGFGHGDAMHFTDVDPDRPGLEVFKANGDGPNPAGIQLRDARTGEQIFGVPSVQSGGVPRAVALDVDPRHRGLEMWGYDARSRPRRWGWWNRRDLAEQPAEANSQEVRPPRPPRPDRRFVFPTGLYAANGTKISDKQPGTCNMAVWWDGDLLRELLNGVRITKWDYEHEEEVELLDGATYDCRANNGSKANPCLCADILGDWREEVVARSADGKELRIFVTTVLTEHRLVTLMHDPIYRLSVAWQNVAYNQPAHPGFYLGEGMSRAVRREK